MGPVSCNCGIALLADFWVPVRYLTLRSCCHQAGKRLSARHRFLQAGLTDQPMHTSLPPACCTSGEESHRRPQPWAAAPWAQGTT